MTLTYSIAIGNTENLACTYPIGKCRNLRVFIYFSERTNISRACVSLSINAACLGVRERGGGESRPLHVHLAERGQRKCRKALLRFLYTRVFEPACDWFFGCTSVLLLLW